jgi:hypothetical protein
VGSTGASEPDKSDSSSGKVRIPFKETIVFEFIIAVVWVVTYLKAGKSWEGLAALAIKYHWPGAQAFHDLFAPGLSSHSRDIAWSFLLVAIFIGVGYRSDWPIGFYTVFICGIVYSYLTLGPLSLIAIALILLLMWWLQNRILSYLYNVIFGLFLAFWVYLLATALNR